MKASDDLYFEYIAKPSAAGFIVEALVVLRMDT